MKDFGLPRDVPVKKGATALLFVDVQSYAAEGNLGVKDLIVRCAD